MYEWILFANSVRTILNKSFSFPFANWHVDLLGQLSGLNGWMLNDLKTYSWVSSGASNIYLNKELQMESIQVQDVQLIDIYNSICGMIKAQS